MKSLLALLILLVFSVVPSFSQVQLITVNSQRNQDNSVSIFTESQAYGDYTVKLIFTTLNGYSANHSLNGNVGLVTVGRGKQEVIRLTPQRSGGINSYQYRYEYFPGRALTKTPDSSFLYLLPSKPGHDVRISKVSSLEERLGQKRSDDFYSTGFVYKLGDTICASRGGVIYASSQEVKEGEKLTQFYKSERNKISIQHKDGSISDYSILAPIQLIVSAGDNVLPGQPLAVFNKESEKYTVLLATFYLDEKKVLRENNENNGNRPSYITYIPTYFYFGENDKPSHLELNKLYTAQTSNSIVTAEMSNRDKKKFKLK